jgi:CheY-like chemotaxis protein
MEPVARKKLGEILIEQKILTPLIVNRVIRIAAATHRRFGETLEDMSLITGEELAQALALQYGYRIVSNLTQFTIPPETLALVPEEEAFGHRLFPLQVKGENLALAMADPTDSDYLGMLSGRTNLKIVPFIAITQDIMKAIAKNYLGEALEFQRNAILLVETDSRERASLSATLTREGFQVLEAVDGPDGLQQALLHMPSLVLTAKEMPGSDGFSLFTSLQGVAETRRIPVILLSSRTSLEEEGAAFQRGFFDYIAMPVEDITLVSRVRRALAAGRSYVPLRGVPVSLELD